MYSPKPLLWPRRPYKVQPFMVLLPLPSFLPSSQAALFAVAEKCQTCSCFRAIVSTVSSAWNVLTQIITRLISSLYSGLCSKNNLSEAPWTILRWELPAPSVTLELITLVLFFFMAPIISGILLWDLIDFIYIYI